MTTQPTNLPVPSESPRNLKFNVGKIDEFVTSMGWTYTDRFGVKHYTIEGINYLAQQAMNAFGYVTLNDVDFTTGATVSNPNEVLLNTEDSSYYKWTGSFASGGKIVPPNSTPESTGGVGAGKWINVGDASLRSDLANSTPANINLLIGGLNGSYSLPVKFIVVDNYPYNGDFKSALSCASAGSVFWLGKKTYNITGLYGSVVNTIENISIIGSGMPQLSDDKTRFVDGTGTIIQGAIKNQAKGFKTFDFGIDVGSYVSQSVYATETYEDALAHDNVGDNANIEIRNIKTLSAVNVSSKPQTHSVRLERLSGVTMGYVECIGGFHGLTIKCQKLQGGIANCYGQYGDAFIFKSDSGGPCADIYIESITVGLAYNVGWPDVTYGGIYDAHDGITIDNIHIGTLRVQSSSWGLTQEPASTGSITNITIGNYYANTVYGNYYSLEVSSKCVNWKIGGHIISGVSGGIKIDPASAYVVLEDGSTKGSSQAGYSLGGDTLAHGTLISNENNIGVEYTGGLGFNPDRIVAYGNNVVNISALPTAISGSALNGWTIESNFKAIPCGHRVFIRGRLTKGTSSDAFTISTPLRPKEDIPVHGVGLSSGSSAIPVQAWIRSATHPTKPGVFEVEGYASTASYIDFNCSYDVG